MRSFFILMLLLTGCGYSSKNNEVIGQVKKVAKLTPLICPDRTEVDLSLGVMRNGVGSMSSQDQWFYVEDKELLKKLEKANAEALIVKIIFDVKRITFCADDHQVSAVDFL